MGPQYPLWFALLLMPVIFWPVTLIVGIVFAGFGKWFSGVGRWICWGLSGVLLLFPLALLVRIASDPVSDWWTAQRLKAIDGKLQQPMTVDGILLPAGTDVHWLSLDKSAFKMATVPAPVAMRGLVVKGTIKRDTRGEGGYEVVLAEPKQVDAWACGPGDAAVGKDGRLSACTLGRETVWHTLTLPAGTFMDRLDGMRFVLPDERGMAVLGALQVPSSGVIEADENGTLRDVQATWRGKTDGQKMLVERGIRFGAKMEFYPSLERKEHEKDMVKALALAGELGEDVRCAGETVKAGTPVRIGPVGDELVVVGEGRGVRRVAGCVR